VVYDVDREVGVRICQLGVKFCIEGTVDRFPEVVAASDYVIDVSCRRCSDLIRSRV